MHRKIILATVLLFCWAALGIVTPNDMRYVYEEPNLAIQEAAKATVIIVPKSLIEFTADGKWRRKLTNISYGDQNGNHPWDDFELDGRYTLEDFFREPYHQMVSGTPFLPMNGVCEYEPWRNDPAIFRYKENPFDNSSLFNSKKLADYSCGGFLIETFINGQRELLVTTLKSCLDMNPLDKPGGWPSDNSCQEETECFCEKNLLFPSCKDYYIIFNFIRNSDGTYNQDARNVYECEEPVKYAMLTLPLDFPKNAPHPPAEIFSYISINSKRLPHATFRLRIDDSHQDPTLSEGSGGLGVTPVSLTHLSNIKASTKPYNTSTAVLTIGPAQNSVLRVIGGYVDFHQIHGEKANRITDVDKCGMGTSCARIYKYFKDIPGTDGATKDIYTTIDGFAGTYGSPVFKISYDGSNYESASISLIGLNIESLGTTFGRGGTGFLYLRNHPYWFDEEGEIAYPPDIPTDFECGVYPTQVEDYFCANILYNDRLIEGTSDYCLYTTYPPVKAGHIEEYESDLTKCDPSQQSNCCGNGILDQPREECEQETETKPGKACYIKNDPERGDPDRKILGCYDCKCVPYFSAQITTLIDDEEEDDKPFIIDGCAWAAGNDFIDTDGDHWYDACDNCPQTWNPCQVDRDSDDVGNACDNCPTNNNPINEYTGKQDDADDDGVGDACDRCPGFDDRIDPDGDGVPGYIVYVDKDGKKCDDDVSVFCGAIIMGCDPCPYTRNREKTAGRPNTIEWNESLKKWEVLQEFDDDGDGIPNECDVCPGAPDSFDLDGDGIPDGCDNCNYMDPKNFGHYDFRLAFGSGPLPAPNTEIIFGQPRNDSGAYFSGIWASDVRGLLWDRVWGSGDTRTKTVVIRQNDGYGWYYRAFTEEDFAWFIPSIKGQLPPGYMELYWQIDYDMDGIGDVCDGKGHTSIAVAENSWDTITKTTGTLPSGLPIYLLGSNVGRLLLVDMSLWGKEPDTGVEMGPTPKVGWELRYCGTIDRNDLEFWGQVGYCTLAQIDYEEGDGAAKYPQMTPLLEKPAINYGYSHGSDPRPFDNRGLPYWKAPFTSLREDVADALFEVVRREKNKGASGQVPEAEDLSPIHNDIPQKTNRYFWNWRADFCYYTRDLSDCNALANPASAWGESRQLYYTLSTAPGPFQIKHSDYPDPAESTVSDGSKRLNPLFFANAFEPGSNKPNYLSSNRPTVYSRSTRMTNHYNTAAFYFTNLVRPIYIIDPGKVRIPPKEFPSATLKPFMTDKVRSGTRFVSDTEINYFKMMLPPNTFGAIPSGAGAWYAVGYRDGGTVTVPTKEYVLYQGTEAAVADWQLRGVIPEVPEDAEVIGGILKGAVLYLAVYRSGNSMVDIVSIDPRQTSLAYTHRVRIPGLDNIRLAFIGDDLFIAGTSANTMSLYRHDTLEDTVTEIPTATQPARERYTLHVDEGKFYIVGGVYNDGSEARAVLKLNTEESEPTWNTVIADIGQKLFMPAVHSTEGMLRIVDLEAIGETTPSFLLDTNIGTVITELITVNGYYPMYEENGYCLLDDETSLQGGTVVNANCTPFAYPWYKSFSIGTTVYSVAGKGDRLYVGTNSTIRVYDISDSNAMVLKSTFTTNRRVYDLEVVEGDIMYAATSGGIYKFNTANPDAISQLSFYSTPYNYQYRIQYYEDKLYVGDDNGINIRHKDTFARLAYVNFGSVVDFAIANGELALYWYAFWDEGVQVRDADTLTLKAYEYGYCSTGELTTDHGAFYLACDGYEYRFAGRPDTYIDFWELNGDIREMAENHLYNGWVYIPDGSAVKVSTNNEVPSYCGNGVVEPGEVCDGNSVYCEDLDPIQWNAGTATCKSDCSGYNTGNCYWSGC